MTYWRLNQVLSLQIASIVSMPLLTLALISYLWVIPQVKNDIEHQHQAIAATVVEKIQTYLGGAVHELTAISRFLKQYYSSSDSDSNSSDQILLDSHIHDQYLFESISVIDKEGVIRAIGLPLQRQDQGDTYLGIDMSENSHYQNTKRQQAPVWSDTYQSIITDHLTIAIALPIDGAQVLIAEMSLAQLSDFSKLSGSSSPRITMLIDRKAHLISDSSSPKSGHKISLQNLAIVTDGLTNGSSTQEFHYQGRVYVGSSALDPSMHWLVLVAQEKQSAYQYITLAIEAIIIVSLITLLTAILSGIYLAQGLAARIGSYSNNARKIAEGNYQLRWPQIKISEFNTLADHLQQMAISIQHREQALSDSEASLRATMEQTPNVAIQWFDIDGTVLYWNKASEQLYQRSRKQTVGQSLALISPGKQQQQRLKLFRKVAATGAAIGPYEGCVIRPDHARRDTLCTTFMIPDSEHGKRFVCMDIDITEQKSAEKTLRDREQRYRALVQQSPVAVIEWDLDFKVQEWNETAEEIFGYSRDEAIGQHAKFIVPPDLHEHIESIIATLEINIGGYRSDNANITAGNRRITCQWYNQPIVNEKGSIVAIMSLIDDVSDRKRMEAKLRASEQKFISLFQSSPVAMSVSYFSDNPRFSNCNDAWLRLFGLNRNDVIGYSNDDLHIWQNTGEHQQQKLWQQLEELRVIDDLQVEMIHQDGTTINCLISARFIDIGSTRMVATAYNDITQQVQAEAEIHQLNLSLETRVLERTSELQTALQHLQRAQDDLVHSEKLASLGALVGGIAHELNTPIGNSLMAATTLIQLTQELEQQINSGTLKRSILDHHLQDAHAGCTIIEQNLRRASELVTSFKQVAVDQTSSQRRKFQLQEVISEISITLAPSLKKTPFELEQQIPGEIILDSYPGPLGQVLTNLINNAILHAFDGKQQGCIKIKASHLDGNQVSLIVADNGNGIKLEDQAKVFDPFFTSKLGQGGSGLGLNIVHNITNQILGGRIEVDSTPGVGTRMVLTLPLTAPISEANEGEIE